MSEEAPDRATDRQERTPPERADSFARRAILTIGIAALVVLLLLFMWYVLQVILLIFLGLLLAILLRTPATWLSDRTPLPYHGALVVVLVVLLGLFVLGGWLIAPNIASQFAQLSEALPEGGEQVGAWLRQYAWGQQLLDQIPSLGELTPSGGTLLARVSDIFSGVFGLVTNTLLALFIGFYFAFQPEIYRRGIVKLLPLDRRARGREVLEAIGLSLKWWLLGRLFAMFVLGLLVGLGLWLLGVPFALVLGLLTGLFSFIPAVGAVLAVLPAALVALSQGPAQLLYVLLLYSAIQFVESYMLTPAVQQYAVSMPPALALVAQLLLGLLAGPLGVALAVPLAVVGLVLVKMLYVEDVLGDEVAVLREPGGARGKS